MQMAQLYNAKALMEECMRVMLDNYDTIRERYFPGRTTTDEETNAISEAEPTTERLELDEATITALQARWAQRRGLRGPFIYVPKTIIY